jgi:hypothetical protein
MARALPPANATRVFINCPFDKAYKELFDAAVFTIHDLGFQARHALINVGSAIRLTRIADELAQAMYSIHDISRVEVSGALKVPRFNMPFEAGFAYCLHEFHKRHVLLLDAKPYRYRASLSDVAGLDPKIHGNKPEQIVENVREFLVSKSDQPKLPGGQFIWRRYVLFRKKLPLIAKADHKTMKEIRSWSYVNELQAMMAVWIQANPP